MKSQELKKQLEDAHEYIKKIGASEPHLSTVGKLSKLSVNTEVCHQARESAKNYHCDGFFDKALSEVVRKRFAELAGEALVLMEDKYKEQRKSEKDELIAQLAEIEALEKEA